MLGGSIYIEEFDDSFDTEAGGLFLARIQGFVGPKISVGAQALLAYPTLTVGGSDFDLSLMNFAPTLSAHFGSDALMISPGVAFAYQTISTDDLDSTVEGFSPGAFIELSFPFSKAVRGAAEAGFISQPSGGNEDTEVTFGPIFYLAVGLSVGG